MLGFKAVQEKTEIIIARLRSNAEYNRGQLQFTNDDLAVAAGYTKPNQRRPVGNITSRLDFVCYLVDLPPICSAAEKPFAMAWHNASLRRLGLSWEWPKDDLIAAAKARRWTPADFDALLRESRHVTGSKATILWNDELVRRGAKMQAWAFGMEARVRGRR